MRFRINFKKDEALVRIQIMEGDKKLDVLYVKEFKSIAPSRALVSGRNFYMEYEGELELSNDGQEAFIHD